MEVTVEETLRHIIGKHLGVDPKSIARGDILDDLGLEDQDLALIMIEVENLFVLGKLKANGGADVIFGLQDLTSRQTFGEVLDRVVSITANGAS